MTESTFRSGKVRQIRIELPVEISERAVGEIAEYLLWPIELIEVP